MTQSPKSQSAKTLSAKTLSAKTLSAKTLSAKTLSAKTLSAKTLSAKTLSAKPQFGHRHHRPAPRSGLDDSPASVWRRFDWPLVALVAVVFLEGFVWLFPG